VEAEAKRPEVIVHQTKPGECAAACVAMASKKTLDEALSVLGEARGVDSNEVIHALSVFGIKATEVLSLFDGDFSAILVVPSLNYSGLLHYIYWDGKQYLDPSPIDRRRYPDASPLPPLSGEQLPPQWAAAIVIQDTGLK